MTKREFIDYINSIVEDGEELIGYSYNDNDDSYFIIQRVGDYNGIYWQIYGINSDGSDVWLDGITHYYVDIIHKAQKHNIQLL